MIPFYFKFVKSSKLVIQNLVINHLIWWLKNGSHTVIEIFFHFRIWWRWTNSTSFIGTWQIILLSLTKVSPFLTWGFLNTFFNQFV